MTKSMLLVRRYVVLAANFTSLIYRLHNKQIYRQPLLRVRSRRMDVDVKFCFVLNIVERQL